MEKKRESEISSICFVSGMQRGAEFDRLSAQQIHQLGLSPTQEKFIVTLRGRARVQSPQTPPRILDGYVHITGRLPRINAPTSAPASDVGSVTLEASTVSNSPPPPKIQTPPQGLQRQPAVQELEAFKRLITECSDSDSENRELNLFLFV